MKKNKFNLKIGGKDIEVEARNLAEQANGDILVRCGDTLILATCVMEKKDRENLILVIQSPPANDKSRISKLVVINTTGVQEL